MSSSLDNTMTGTSTLLAAVCDLAGDNVAENKEEEKLPSLPYLISAALKFLDSAETSHGFVLDPCETLGPWGKVLEGGILLCPVTLCQNMLANPNQLLIILMV